MSWGNLVSGGGSLLSAGLGYLGQREANRTNVDIANRATMANSMEAQKQRDFQKEMSNTSHQRQIADLESAGLNPLLSATGGASSPSGAAGSAATTSVENEIGAGITSAIEAKTMELAIKKQKQEITNMQAEKENIKSQTYRNSVEANVKSKDIPKADFINKVYKNIMPMINKGMNSLESGARKITPKYKHTPEWRQR